MAVVKERMRLKGLENKELADIAGMSLRNFERIFEESIVPSPSNRASIDRALNIDPEDSKQLRDADRREEAKTENQRGLAVTSAGESRPGATESRMDLPRLLRENDISEEFINDVIIYSSEEVLPFNLRSLLARFFRIVIEKSDFAVRDGSFSDNLKIVQQIGWLTDDEVTQITRLYDFLTGAFESPENSFINAAHLRDPVLQAISLIARRMRDKTAVTNKPSSSYIQDESFWAEKFVNDMRAGQFNGPAFKRRIDRDLMQAIRGLLRSSDIDVLFHIITDPTMPPDLRSNCASLIISPGTRYRNRQGVIRTVLALEDYVRKNIDNETALPEEVLRCIGLAVANQESRADILLDFLSSRAKGMSVERWLKISDEYYGDVFTAMEYCTNRLSDYRFSEKGCVWEAFYVAHRSDEANRETNKRLLESRLHRIEAGSRLQRLWEELCRKIADPNYDLTF
ncbi:MAG: hypothetical protein AB7H90_05340 [Alphaproteobacteria bacterium]